MKLRHFRGFVDPAESENQHEKCLRQKLCSPHSQKLFAFGNLKSTQIRPGAEWVLQDLFPTGHTVRLCQNRNFLQHYHATLYDVKKRIPVYSVGKFMRAPGIEENDRIGPQAF